MRRCVSAPASARAAPPRPAPASWTGNRSRPPQGGAAHLSGLRRGQAGEGTQAPAAGRYPGPGGHSAGPPRRCPRWSRRPTLARGHSPPRHRPAASAPPVGRHRLARGLQRLGRADAGLDGGDRQAPLALALGRARAGAAGGAAGLRGAAAPRGRRKDARLDRALAPHQQRLRVPAGDFRVRHLPNDDTCHAPPASRMLGLEPFQMPSSIS
jgi:hypothetical protein